MAMDKRVLGLFGRQYGLASRAQLTSNGLTDDAIRGRVTAGILTTVHRGVYRLAGTAESFHGDCTAVTLTGRGAVISHQSAGRLWGLRQMNHTMLHVTVPHGRRPLTGDRIKFHRSTVIPVEHTDTRHAGICVTTVDRTLFDLANALSPERHESAVEHALRLGLTTIENLAVIGQVMSTRGRPGSRRFIAMIDGRSPERRPVDSDGELVLERALMAAGLPRPVRQHTLRIPGGVTIHPDLAWPDVRLAVEFDHATWHSGVAASLDDRSRDRGLRAISWDVERVSDRELRDRRQSVVTEIARIYHHRLATLTALGQLE